MLSTSTDLSGSRAVCPPEIARMGVGPGPRPPGAVCIGLGAQLGLGPVPPRGTQPQSHSLSTLSQPVPGLRAEESLLCLRGGP